MQQRTVTPAARDARGVILGALLLAACQGRSSATPEADAGDAGDASCYDLECSTEIGDAYCTPTPPSMAGTFPCTTTNCKVGQVCIHHQLCSDGCEDFSCADVPTPCTSTPTCACVIANESTLIYGTFPGSTCTVDAGNMTLTYCR